MPIVSATELRKVYRVSEKAPGLAGTLRHFFKRRYRDVEAVKGVTFGIEPGEIVGFLGPNGAGKTTVLKMLTGLIHPTAGRCEVAGFTPFRRQAAFLKTITLVIGQKQQLLWDLPALDSLRINAAVYDITDADFTRRIGELSEMLQLIDGELRKPVRKLSLGERMKAELLAALLHRPQILFLDEPTLGLDVNAQAAIRRFLRDYNQAHGATGLLTSHYMADITALCQRVLMIHKGDLIYDGSLGGVLERFAPYREVKVELNRDCDGLDLSRYGELESCHGRDVRFIVERKQLKETVNRLLAELDVADLTITDPPVEQVIGRVFQEGLPS